MVFISHTCANLEWRGAGGPPPPPPPLENYKNIGFLSNTGLDPLKITKLLFQHSMLGHHRPARETPFKRRIVGGPLMARICESRGGGQGGRTKAHWTILIWQGRQKPTSLNQIWFKSFIKQFTLIRLLLQGISHMQCVFTDIIISPECCDKQLNWGVKSH